MMKRSKLFNLVAIIFTIFNMIITSAGTPVRHRSDIRSSRKVRQVTIGEQAVSILEINFEDDGVNPELNVSHKNI